jgi:hypothetical protein
VLWIRNSSGTVDPNLENHHQVWFPAVFRIHDILVRIRILGSVPLTNDSGCGSGSCSHRQKPSRCKQKVSFFSLTFYAYSFLKVHLQHSSKIKKSPGSHNTVEIQIFLRFLLVDGRIRMRARRPKNIWILKIRIRNTGTRNDL